MSYPLETKARARQLYVEEQMSLDDVAAEVGVSTSGLKIWAAEGNWKKEREEFESTVLQLSSKVQKLKLKLADDALRTGDPQKIYALGGLLRATQVRARSDGSIDKATLFLDFLGKFLEFLKGRDQEALRYLEPHLRGFAETMKQAEA